MKLCTAIVYAALALIVILAIPMCIFLGAMILVWSTADRMIRRIET